MKDIQTQAEALAAIHGPAPLSTTVDAQGVLYAMQAVQQVLKECATDGEDYMRLPGTTKDTMLQPLAEKLAMGARLIPDPHVELVDLAGEHREYRVSGHLLDEGGVIRGTGFASCSTLESKYRWRYVSAPCPKCGKEGTVMRSQYPDRNAPSTDDLPWYCNAKKEGCGATIPYSAGEFKTSRKENPELPDVWNTVEQMALKRWLVSTVKRTLALSGMFTMDLEDHAPQQEPRKPVETAKRDGGRKPRKPRKPKKPDGPNYDRMAEEEAAAKASRQSSGRILSPAEAKSLMGKAEKANVKMTLALAKAGWDGDILRLPFGMVEKVETAINELSREEGAP